MTRSRLKKLLTLADQVRCRVCGHRPADDENSRGPDFDLEKLTAAERAELSRLMARTHRTCPGCGRVTPDFATTSTADLNRVLDLLDRAIVPVDSIFRHARPEPDLTAVSE